MKYAVVDPRGRVFKVLDEATPRTIEISDEVANQIKNIKDPILIDGVVTSRILQREAGYNLRWNEDNKSWDKLVIKKPVPNSITATQIRLWLIRHNISMDAIYSAIESISDPKTKQEVAVLWEYAPYVERKNPFISLFGQALGLNDEQIDQAFREAKTINE